MRVESRDFAGRVLQPYDARAAIADPEAALLVGAWPRPDRAAGRYEGTGGRREPPVFGEYGRYRLERDLELLVRDPAAARIRALVVDSSPVETTDFKSGIHGWLAAPRLANSIPSIEALWVGHVRYFSEDPLGDECGHMLADQVAPVLRAYPRLTTLGVCTGHERLALGELSSVALESLAIEGAALTREQLAEVSRADLPRLRHLELWLGSEPGEPPRHTLEDLAPLLFGRRFPALRSVALCACPYLDDLLSMLVKAPLLDQLEALDITGCALGDSGAARLLAAPRIARLATLDVTGHCVSPAQLARLAAAGPRLIRDASEDAPDRRVWTAKRFESTWCYGLDLG